MNYKSFDLPLIIHDENIYLNAINEKIDFFRDKFYELLKMKHLKQYVSNIQMQNVRRRPGNHRGNDRLRV